jgi:GNAT superfamily N-acetyltransferase
MLVELEHASCDISPMDNIGLDEQTSSKLRWLSKLYVAPEHRKQGYATKLLQKVIKDAQDAQLALMIEVNPFGDFDMDAETLETFYKKHGFIRLQDKPLLLIKYAEQIEKPKPKINILDRHGKVLN